MALSKQANEIMLACYDQNSLKELQASTKSPDKRDMKEWGISAAEWRAAIAGAIAMKLDDLA